MNDGVLWEDEALRIKWKDGFLENPASFAPGTGIEYIYKNAPATTEVKK